MQKGALWIFELRPTCLISGDLPLTSELKSSLDVTKSVLPSHASLTLEDILRIPSFHGKGKKLKKKTTPTLQYVFSGAKHRKAKLARKKAREEKTRHRREEVERKILERELGKEERKKKSNEVKRRK